jgi:large subunit ribosomal protein L3
MPGPTGTAKRTTQNLQLVKILPEKNLLLIKGSVPGSKGTILTVRVAKKSKVSN